MSTAKSSLSIAKNAPKVIKPGTVAMNSSWNPNAPKPNLTRANSANNFDITDDETQIRLRNEDIFDGIMGNILNVPLEMALEEPLQNLFDCPICVLWIDHPEDGTLYSPTYEIKVSISDSVVGYARLTRSVIQISNQKQCPPCFVVDQTKVGAPENSQHLLFPLSSAGIVRAVIQLIRPPNLPQFAQQELNAVSFVMKKFGFVGNSLFNATPLRNVAVEYFQKKSFSSNPLTVVEHFFQCRTAELWKYDSIGNSFLYYDRQQHNLTPIHSVEFGIVGQSLTKGSTINERMASAHPSYCVPFDGNIDGPILVVPFEKNRREVWGLVLRGRSRSFNIYDEREVSSILPFLARAASGSSSSSSSITSLLTQLLDIASQLVSALSITELINLIQEQSSHLIECERSMILLVDRKNEYFVSRFEESEPIKTPIDKGIAGQCFKEKRIINILDPRKDKRFYPSLDCCPGVEPIMLLAVPLLNLNDEVIGVLILLNKISGERFSDNDEKILTVFNIFSGIAFDNAQHYRSSFKLSNTFLKFVDTTLQTDEEVPVKTVLAGLMQKALGVTFCDRITFFVRENIEEFVSLISVGCETVYGSLFAAEAAENGQPLLMNSDGIESRANEPHRSDNAPSRLTLASRGRSLSEMNSQSVTNLVSGLFSEKHYQLATGKKPDEMIYAVPIINEQLSAVGVMEFHFYNERSIDDLAFLRSFASLCAIGFPKLQLPELAVFGYGELDIRDWITNEEKNSRKVPQKMKIDEKKGKNLYRCQFDVDLWDGIGLFQVVFAIFSKFGLMDAFEFSNSQLFYFLKEIRETYNNVPYCNWKHAIDCVQFIAFEIVSARLDRILAKTEIFALFVAAICHDAGHDFFYRQTESQAESQNATLNRFCSFTETEHCIAAISVLTRDECNIFVGISAAQSKQIWGLIVDLILATDMSRHFTIMNEFFGLVNSGEFDSEEVPQHRIILMKILIKCADISPVSRPFEIAKRSFMYMAEEFYRQGDIDRAEDIFFMSPEGRREDIDKSESVIGFIKNVALPLFNILGKAITSLSIPVDQINTNINRYQKLGKKTKK